MSAEDEVLEPIPPREELVALIFSIGESLAADDPATAPVDRLDAFDLADLERLCREARPMFPRTEDDVRVEMSPAGIIESGFLLEVNRLVLHPAGAAMYVHEETGRVGVFSIPFEEDPEGIFFGPLEGDELDDVREKWIRYRAAVECRSGSRVEASAHGGPETYPINGARVEIRSSIDRDYLK